MKKIFLLITIFGIYFGMQSPVRAVEIADAVELKMDNPYFSPNGDGFSDNIFFTPVLRSDWDVARWKLDVFSPKGKNVQRTTGAGFSSVIQWDGKDKKGNVLPEGEYQIIYAASGPGFNIKSPPKPVTIDNTPPTADLKYSSSPTGSQHMFSLTGQDAFGIDRWQLQILGMTGNTVFVQWSTGPVENVSWDGRDKASGLPVAAGSYKAVFQDWDKAGNASVPAELDFSVAASMSDSAMDLIKSVKPVKTPAGLLVQLDAAEIFLTLKGKPQIRKKALPMLSAVANLINSSQAQVRLDGYSFSSGNSAGDRDLSSLYAWSAYSYFVKEGNVQASRLTVRGRGRSAPEDRMNAKPAYIRNGIEIILVGQGS